MFSCSKFRVRGSRFNVSRSRSASTSANILTLCRLILGPSHQRRVSREGMESEKIKTARNLAAMNRNRNHTPDHSRPSGDFESPPQFLRGLCVKGVSFAGNSGHASKFDQIRPNSTKKILNQIPSAEKLNQKDIFLPITGHRFSFCRSFCLCCRKK